MGRTGALTPAASLKPVFVGGVHGEQRDAAQHGRDGAQGTFRIGDTVIVRRAGDVIPEVVRCLPEKRAAPRRRDIVMPVGLSRVRIARRARRRTRPSYKCTGGISTAARSAPNGSCTLPAAAPWTSKGWARRIVEELVKVDRLKTPADLYSLSEAELGALKFVDDKLKDGKPVERRFGEKNAASLFRAIEKSKQTTLPRFLFALGIPQVGESTARALADQFGDLEPLRHASAAKIEETPDVGPVVSQEIAKFFADPEYQKVVDKLVDANVRWPKIEVAQAESAAVRA